MTLNEQTGFIKQVAADQGFERCGIAAAAPIARAGFLHDWLRKDYAGTMAYLHRHRDSRANIRSWLPWARSIIVVAANYNQKTPDSTNASFSRDPKGSAPHNPQSPTAKLQSRRGRVALYAWGEDYHAVVRERLEALLARMRRRFDEPFAARICVDTAAIIERELAVSAGIGWIGKNTLVLHPALGSFFFLGEIVTDLPLPPDVPEPDHCGSCTRCLEACPTGAFPQPYVMDARRCISYLTIEHHGEIDPALAEKMGDWVFGCDACQTVCPFNRAAPQTSEPRFAAAEDDARPVLDDVLSWDEALYRSRLADKASRRATLHMWHRNARIALRNMELGFPGPPAAVPVGLKNGQEDLRGER